MKLIESARMEGIVDISIKSKESVSVVNGIKSISNGGGSATAEEDLLGGPDADETTDMNDKEIDDLLASDEENSPKATKETTKAPKSDSASTDGKVSSKDATGENGLSNGHSNGTDEKSEKSSEEKSKDSEADEDENGPSEEKSHNGVTEGQPESGEVERGQTDENNKSESQKPDEETPKEEDADG